MKYATSIVLAFMLALTSSLTGAIASAQQGPQQIPAALDNASRRAVVEAAAKVLRERYVFPDVGDKAARAIESALGAGDYNGLDQPPAFALRLTEDLRTIAKDKHLRVNAPGAPGGQPAPVPPRAEGGITRADILDGNVGYIEVVGFPGSTNDPIDRAMAALQKTRALIIDVRRNRGGSPDAVSYLVSYFLRNAQPVHINTFISRNPGTETFRSADFFSSTTPFSYADKPVYVLTSVQTFSGGEEFAYDMQVMKLAKLVGETTGGGANPGGTVPLAAGLTMFIPGGRASNPITGTNWEGVGVIPDVAVSSESALKVALEKLGVSSAGVEIDTISQSRVFVPRTTRQPGGEATLRRVSEELARGEPNYDLFSPQMADVTRPQLAALKERFSSLGPVESVTFVEVASSGDVYDVRYANGGLRWIISLTSDGKLANAGLQPLATRP
jgi:Peptidase family S41/N-terminal domain of Peptidase_S41 in eukaryotic IRBP